MVVDLELLVYWAALALDDILAVGVRELLGNRLAGVWHVSNEDHLVDFAVVVSLELQVKHSVAGLLIRHQSSELLKSGVASTLMLQNDLGGVISDPCDEEARLFLVDFNVS